MARFTDQYGNFFGFKQAKTECLIDGNVVNYDVCGSQDLEYLKQHHHAFNYIGSSNIYYINGVKNNSDELYHFFVKKQTNQK